ncbi:66S pre-ribosomal particle constituent [Salpingoeca rosetta]|uniref:66S pre-ribosomal particle constituent n=1 Tax=Salpingoeca rosetta (strain ATCC 50818 / BSB-021) TaxID=946362 RepID=F2U778_SALR5|nr:66S pre-ribosomal particle constituent [Salpingoeca rosetta]EGD83295.1 66S pre-ribosomal particle constituent [Salpingoeca rosetta]|eukprot:XP_004994799.1 66S pre-ribosomal particle constituent [Salpingoeca rosetta]
MPQNEHIERHRKLHGRRLDHEERMRKKAAREVHRVSKQAQKLRGIKAKLFNKKRHAEKIQMKKTLAMHEERKSKKKKEADVPEGAIPRVSYGSLKATFKLPILGVKKNPSSPLFTQLGVITKGTILEVNVSELGLVTTGGKVVWGK